MQGFYIKKKTNYNIYVKKLLNILKLKEKR